MAGPDGGLSARVMLISRNLAEYQQPFVFLRASCAGATLACAPGGTHAVAVADALRPSTAYWVWADASSNFVPAAGPFTLQVDLSTTPVNDGCGGPLPLPFNTSVPGSRSQRGLDLALGLLSACAPASCLDS